MRYIDATGGQQGQSWVRLGLELGLGLGLGLSESIHCA